MNNKLFKILTLLVFILLSLQARAVRHVGNGGGLAEMLALSSFKQIPIFIEACIDKQIECKMTNEDLVEQKIILAKVSEFTNWQIVFHARLNSEAFFHDGQNISLNSVFLYKADNKPKSVAEIMAFVWSVVWKEYASRPFTETFPSALRVTSQYQDITQSYSFQEFAIDSQLHFFDLLKPTSGEHIQNLYLEYPATTLDLTTKLNEELQCPNATWSVLSKQAELVEDTNVQNSKKNIVRFQADIKWQCKKVRQHTRQQIGVRQSTRPTIQPSHWFGKLIITVPFIDSEPIADQIKLNLIARVKEE